MKVVSSTKALWSQSDVIIKVQSLKKTELEHLDKSKTLIGFFWPGQNEVALKAAKKTGATIIAMDMVPRISRAQKMDALSSMANIAGYRAVIEAGNNFNASLLARLPRLARCPLLKCW